MDLGNINGDMEIACFFRGQSWWAFWFARHFVCL